MLNRTEAEKQGFRINFETEKLYRCDHYYEYSYDGGATWKKHQLYNEPPIILQHELGRFYVETVLKPELKSGESLCGYCKNKGIVGIVKYAGITEGTEKQCQILYDSDGEPYTDDVEYYCRYQIYKCTRCKEIAWSDYA